MKLKTSTTISIFVLIFLISCNKPGKEKTVAKLIDSTITEKPETTFCFRNEYPFENEPNDKDIEELQYSVSGDIVSGTYNWIPMYKNQRTGSFKGILKDNIITALYSFYQEGIEDTVTIKIVLENNKAIVTGTSVELGLEVSIAKVKCDK